MAIRANIDPDQVLTATKAGGIRHDLNSKVRAVPCEEVVVALTPAGLCSASLQALRVLDRSPEIGVILVKTPHPFIVFRKTAFESVSGFDTAAVPDSLLESLYERIKCDRKWSAILSIR